MMEQFLIVVVASELYIQKKKNAQTHTHRGMYVKQWKLSKICSIAPKSVLWFWYCTVLIQVIIFEGCKMKYRQLFLHYFCSYLWVYDDFNIKMCVCFFFLSYRYSSCKIRILLATSSSVRFSHSVMSDSQPHVPQHARPPCPSPTPRVHPNPCPLSQWCHPTISPSVVPFSSCLQSFPISGLF